MGSRAASTTHANGTPLPYTNLGRYAIPWRRRRWPSRWGRGGGDGLDPCLPTLTIFECAFSTSDCDEDDGETLYGTTSLLDVLRPLRYSRVGSHQEYCADELRLRHKAWRESCSPFPNFGNSLFVVGLLGCWDVKTVST